MGASERSPMYDEWSVLGSNRPSSYPKSNSDGVDRLWKLSIQGSCQVGCFGLSRFVAAMS